MSDISAKLLSEAKNFIAPEIFKSILVVFPSNDPLVIK